MRKLGILLLTTVVVHLAGAAVVCQAAWAQPAADDAWAPQARGEHLCGVAGGSTGFSSLNLTTWRSLGVNVCEAVHSDDL